MSPPRSSPATARVEFAYDAGGNRSQVTPPGRPTHTFGFTEADLGSSYTPPAVDAGPTTVASTYNLDRQASRVDLPTGQAVEFSYDSAGRLSRLGLARGQVSYSYEPATGRLGVIDTSAGVRLEYTYDGALVLAETMTGPAAGGVSVTYDNESVPPRRPPEGPPSPWATTPTVC